MDAPVYHLEHVVHAKEEMEDFNGPLDLILHLLSKNKMEIKDIQISLILDQYLAWMDRRKEMDLEIASEFVTMAAHLVYIKTRMLLSIQDEEAASEMEQLIASLEEHQRHENYSRIQQLVPELDRRYRVGRDYLTRGAEHLPKDHTYRSFSRPCGISSAAQGRFGRLQYRHLRELWDMSLTRSRIKSRRSFPACFGPELPGFGCCFAAIGAALKLWPLFWRYWSCARADGLIWRAPSRTVL